MHRFSWSALLLVAVLGTSGCVTGRRSIDLDVPPGQVNSQSKGTITLLAVEDQREFQNKPPKPSIPSIDGDVNKVSKDSLKIMIGRQRNGYGRAMGDIALANGQTVESKMRQLVAESLKRRGYTVSDSAVGNNNVKVSIDKFWAWFTPGFFAVDFEAQLSVELTTVINGRTEQHTVTGYGKNGGQVASDANWQLAYSRAFEDFLHNLDDELARAGL